MGSKFQCYGGVQPLAPTTAFSDAAQNAARTDLPNIPMGGFFSFTQELGVCGYYAVKLRDMEHDLLSYRFRLQLARVRRELQKQGATHVYATISGQMTQKRFSSISPEDGVAE